MNLIEENDVEMQKHTTIMCEKIIETINNYLNDNLNNSKFSKEVNSEVVFNLIGNALANVLLSTLEYTLKDNAPQDVKKRIVLQYTELLLFKLNSKFDNDLDYVNTAQQEISTNKAFSASHVDSLSRDQLNQHVKMINLIMIGYMVANKIDEIKVYPQAISGIIQGAIEFAGGDDEEGRYLAIRLHQKQELND